MFFLFQYSWRGKKLTSNLEETLENLFGDLNAGVNQKFQRQREFYKKIKSKGSQK